ITSTSRRPSLIKRLGSAMSGKFHLTKSPSNTQLLPEYNVLVLGETQSGKSTLIECMRKYADPLVEINTQALGTGFSYAGEYYVQEKGVERVNYGDFLKIPDEYDYEDALNMRKGFKRKKGASQLDHHAHRHRHQAH
ncbi:hypothetical protein BG006_003758, partial [Podila minutissima]